MQRQESEQPRRRFQPKQRSATEQLAGETARRIIHEVGLPDETATWRTITHIVHEALEAQPRR